MSPIDAIRSLWGGVVYRLRAGAYVPLSELPPPMSWMPIQPGGYLYDLDSSQRFVRPYPLTIGPYPHPAFGYSNRPFNNLQGTFPIYQVLDNSITRLPSGPYGGGTYGVVVQGGMNWGAVMGVNGLLKQGGIG